MNAFGLPDNAAVITTTYVMRERMPILYVTHDTDDATLEEVWEFHCGNGDYSYARLMFVALIEVIALDATVAEVADTLSGYAARREALGSPWIIAPLV